MNPMPNASHYERRRAWYHHQYWSASEAPAESSRNGFADYPSATYDRFAAIVRERARADEIALLDLGCGTGLLLKHIRDRVPFRVVPHGVDFLEEAIREARRVHHPEYAENFVVGNIKDHGIEPGRFDIVLLDPSLLATDDFPPLLHHLATSPRTTVLLYTYADVLEAMGVRTFEEMPCLRNVRGSFRSHDDVSFAMVPA